MRWKNKKAEMPKNGEKRSRFVFAWKKTRVCKWTVWLEHYEVHETFFQPASGLPGWWVEDSRNPADFYM